MRRADPIGQVERAIETLTQAQEINGTHKPTSGSRAAQVERLLNAAQAHLRSALYHADREGAR